MIAIIKTLSSPQDYQGTAFAAVAALANGTIPLPLSKKHIQRYSGVIPRVALRQKDLATRMRARNRLEKPQQASIAIDGWKKSAGIRRVSRIRAFTHETYSSCDFFIDIALGGSQR